MAAINTSADIHSFMQAANAAAARTVLGISLTQAASAALVQTGAFTVTLAAGAAVTLTLPLVSGTLATLAGTETLTNKSITSAALTTCTIGSAGVTFAGSSSGSTVLKAAATASGTVTIPAGTDTLVTLTASQILSGKTFTAPVLGVATCTTINGLTVTTTSGGTLTVANASTLGLSGGAALTFSCGSTTTATVPTGTVTLFSTKTGSITSLELKTALTDETGSGAAVFATSPTLVTPVLGAATATSLVAAGNITSGANVECQTLAVGSNAVFSDDVDVVGDITAGRVIGQLRPYIELYPADGPITVTSGIHHITKASIAAISISAPSSQDGELLYISSGSDFAHVVTFTGATLRDGTTGGHTTVTFPAFAGSSVTVFARGSNWYVLSNNGTVIT